MSRKAVRYASTLATPSRRPFSATCCRHGSFDMDLRGTARPRQPADSDALANRSTPELTSPIWTVPPFRFAQIKSLVGTKRSPIFLPTERSKTPTLFHYFYEPAYKLGHVANEILMNRDHALHIKFRRKYEAMQKDCLWWTAVTGLKVSPKRFIRDEVNRKLESAFRAALLERGFNKIGQKVINDKVDPQGSLKGTLHLVTRPEVLRATPEGSKKEALWIVDALIRLFRGQEMRNAPHEKSRERRPSKPQGKSYTQRM